MEEFPIASAGLPDDFIRDDKALFAYIDALRTSVKAKVAAEQRRGLPLSEIVAQVREMIRVAEAGVHPAIPFPSRAFRAISRQAVAWCVEDFRPSRAGATRPVIGQPVAHTLTPSHDPVA